MTPGTVQISNFSWNKRLAKCVKLGQYEEVIKLFQQMKQLGIHPDRFTFVPVLQACANLKDLEEGKRVHTQIIQRGHESDGYVSNGLIDMYTKCGSADDAWRVFRKMPRVDAVAWTTMILGCVKCGQGRMALELWHRMQLEGVEPSPFTLLGSSMRVPVQWLLEKAGVSTNKSLKEALSPIASWGAPWLTCIASVGA